MTPKRQRPRSPGRTQSLEEFQALLAAEFDFLVDRHGFRKADVPFNRYAASFTRAHLELQVLGESWGQSARLRVLLAGESVPIVPLARPPETRSEPSDCPQADDLRDVAQLLRTRLLPVLDGDTTLLEESLRLQAMELEGRRARRAADPRGAFFSEADRLWKNGRWAELAEHLRSPRYPLSKVWQDRLGEAREKLDSGS